MKPSFLFVYFGVLILVSSMAVSSETVNLPRFNYHCEGDCGPHLTLSGFSSGGGFAQILQFSYPEMFQGIAVFSHNFYRCGRPNGDVDNYDNVCTILTNTKPEEWYDPLLVHKDIDDYYSRNLIGDPKMLKDKKLYVYASLRSSVFAPEMSLNILKVYERYIQNAEAIRIRVQDSPFVLPTNNNYGPSCWPGEQISANSTFIGNCGFSGALEALKFLSGSRVNKKPKDNEAVHLEQLVEFNQKEFYQDIPLAQHQMDTIGYYYKPKQCSVKNHKCLIHFYFHGCRAGREFAGTNHISNSGFLEVAELNNIILIFPQTISTPLGSQSGCWDTFGVSGPLYATREGIQVKIVKAMIDRVLG